MAGLRDGPWNLVEVERDLEGRPEFISPKAAEHDFQVGGGLALAIVESAPVDYIVPQHEVRLATFVTPDRRVEGSPRAPMIMPPSLRSSLIEIDGDDIAASIWACDDQEPGHVPHHQCEVAGLFEKGQRL